MMPGPGPPHSIPINPAHSVPHNMPEMYGPHNGHVHPTPSQAPRPPPPAQLIVDLRKEIEEIENEIKVSEDNLKAQHESTEAQKKKIVDDTIQKAEGDQLMKEAQQSLLDLENFDLCLQPILNSCTKDSISAGKGWISSKCTDPTHYELVFRFLLQKITSNELKFDQKLHVLYLINDLFSHSIRKRIDSLKQALNFAIVPIYSCTYVDCQPDQQARLIKVRSNFNKFCLFA